MRIGAALAAALLALAAGVPATALFAQTGTTTQTGGASTKWQAPVPDIDALTCAAPTRLYQIRLDTGDGAIYYCDGDSWEPLGGGGGASTLDDLTDVATAGAAPGEALTYTGTGWAPSAAAVIQEGDARLTDARAPTPHADSHEVGGSDPVELVLDDLTDVEADGGAEVGDVLKFSGELWTFGGLQLEDLGGTLPAGKGGTGLDTSGSTGVPSIDAGVWSVGDVVLGSQTSGGYAGSASEGGSADSAEGLQYGAVFPVSPATSDVFAVTDDSAAGACDSAAGSALTLCRWDGAVWVALGDGTGSDDQTAAEVPYTPTTGADWTDPDPTEAGGALDDLAGRVTIDEAALSTHDGDADAHHAEDHAARHSLGGGDPVTATNLASPCTDAQVLGGTAAGTGVECQADAAGYTTVADEGSALAARATLNLTGAGVSCADNAGSSRTDCTIAGGGSGDVVGPASATDNAIARFDLTTGKLLQNSTLIVGDTGILSVASGGPHHLTNSSAANRLYIDDFGTRLYDGGSELLRLSLSPGIQARSDVHYLWSSTTNPTGTKDTGFKRCAAGVACATDGSTGAGSLSSLMAQLVPQASAPTCPAGNGGLYFDSSGSGALCACPPGGAWAMIHDFGSGNCT